VAVETGTNPIPGTFPRRRSGLGGIILIAIGALFLAGELMPSMLIGQYLLLTLGVVFLAWGIVTRKGGLLIPGSILSGLGTGVVILTRSQAYLQAPADGGVMVTCLALGFAAITLLTALFAERTHWWALIPASVLGLVGSSLLLGDENLSNLVFLGQIWPLFLIILGVALLFKRR
jgi:hypothetical protein